MTSSEFWNIKRFRCVDGTSDALLELKTSDSNNLRKKSLKKRPFGSRLLR